MSYDISKVLNIALSQDGYMEKAKAYKDNIEVLKSKDQGVGQDNITIYWKDLAPGMQGGQWCNCFVNWCFTMAYGLAEAKKLLCIEGGWSFYTPTSSSYFKKRGQWYTTPQAGDVIYFKNSTRICHVGIVTNVDKSKVYTIEGNTSSTKGMVSNGGCVRQKSYSLKSTYIAGYGRPNYSGTVAATTTRATIGLGSTGADVRYLHKKLRALKYGVSENNDTFDSLTEQCVKHFQKVNKLEVDGICGPKTWACIG